MPRSWQSMARTFSENWYRVSDLRLELRPTVSARLHTYRGEPWYVLHDQAHHTFHRVDAPTWRFLSRLTVDATVDQVWRAAIEADPKAAPGQEDVFRLLVSLYRANLLRLEGTTDASRLVERGRDKKRKPLLARLSELMFLRIPLFDPEKFLQRNESGIARLLGWPGLLISLVLLAWAGVELAHAGRAAWSQGERLLQLDNVVLLYVAVFLAKGLHELGHAVMCKRFGGEVHTIGVMLLMFTPLPYVDVTSSWGFRSRHKRALVGAAGMMADMVVAAAATILWAHSPPGMVNELAYNLMFSTAVYTLLFNLNPLMRFDGYYILSDLIGVPNLHEQSRAQFMRWFRTRILDIDDRDMAAHSRTASFWLIAFFVASNLYRLFVMAGIVLLIADAYLGLGLVVALALALSSFVLPLQNMWRNLRDPLFRYQKRALLGKVGLALGVLLVFLFLVPMPDNRVLPGVVEAHKVSRVYTEAGGIVSRVVAVSGSWVQPGQLLVELENPELDADLKGVEAQISQAETLQARSLNEGAVDLAPLEERVKTLEELKKTLERQKHALSVKAAHAGYWVGDDLPYKQGMWVARGAELGQVLDDRQDRFIGVIRQEAGAVLTRAKPDGLEVRIEGGRQQAIPASRLTLVPSSQETLPSAALSPLAGGEVPVSSNDPSGRRSVEPFFQLQAVMDAPARRDAEGSVRTGRSGWIRVHLPWQPLGFQAWGAVRQFFQRRYHV